MPRPHWTTMALGAWCAVLMTALLLPLSQPGPLTLRDMVVLPHPALSPGAVGWGDLPARNSPQDGVLALAGMILDASYCARAAIFLAALAAVAGALAIAGGHHRPISSAAAVMMALWNPFIIERLLQGHWSLVIGVWLLIPLTWAGLNGHTRLQALCLWAASLTPTGAILGLITGLITARRRIVIICWGLLCCLPWLSPALSATLHHSPSALVSAASVTAFSPRAESLSGTAGTLLGLGGIWNSSAVPASREAGCALVGAVLGLVILGCARSCPRPIRLLLILGLGGAVLAWMFPKPLAWAVSTIPGAGLFRDSQKLLGLALPGYVWVCARIQRRTIAAALIPLMFFAMPDAPLALKELTPRDSSIAIDGSFAQGKEVLIPGVGAVTTINGTPMVQPWSKAVALVEPGELQVDGIITDAANPRYLAAMEAWEHQDIATLEQLGIGVVATSHGEVLATTPAPAPSLTAGLSLHLAWLVLPLLLLWPSRWLPRRIAERKSALGTPTQLGVEDSAAN